MCKAVTILSLFSALLCSNVYAGLNEQCSSDCQFQIKILEAQSIAIASIVWETRGLAILNVKEVGLSSSYLAVKMKALEFLESPISSLIGSVRGPAIESATQIALSSFNAQVEKRTLELLATPLTSLVPSIRGLTIQKVGDIGVQSDTLEVKQHAYELLKNLEASWNNFSFSDSTSLAAREQAIAILNSMPR